MPGLLQIKVSPRTRLKGFSAELQRAVDAVSDMAPTWSQVFEPFMAQHMKQQFASQGRAGGKQWAGLEREPRYQAFKRALVGNAPVLRWPSPREQLYPSLVERGHPLHIERRGQERARFGTAVPHAARLEQGGIGPFGEAYPARPILVLGNDRIAVLANLVRADLLARIGKTRRPAVRL